MSNNPQHFVYVMLRSDGKVKIGRSDDPTKRAIALERVFGHDFKVIRTWGMDWSMACHTEAHTLSILANYRPQSREKETFDVSVETAIIAVEKAIFRAAKRPEPLLYEITEAETHPRVYALAPAQPRPSLGALARECLLSHGIEDENSPEAWAFAEKWTGSIMNDEH